MVRRRAAQSDNGAAKQLLIHFVHFVFGGEIKGYASAFGKLAPVGILHEGKVSVTAIQPDGVFGQLIDRKFQNLGIIFDRLL